MIYLEQNLNCNHLQVSKLKIITNNLLYKNIFLVHNFVN